MISSSWKSSNGLPEDVVIEILERLPVKTLIRLKCVCKRWCNLISSADSHFVSRHLEKSTINTRVPHNVEHPCRVVLKKFNWKRTWTTRTVDYPRYVYDFVKLDGIVGNTFGSRDRSYSVVGYCDGVFCLTANHLERDVDYRHLFKGSPTIALCNPALREIRILPFSNLDSPPYRQTVHCDIGFCFDPKTKDYKVVKVVSLSHISIDFVEVYSLASNSWRTVIGDPLPPPPPHIRGIAASGHGPATCTTTSDGSVVFHWITYEHRDEYTTDRVIVSFYMDNNEHDEHYSLRVTPMPIGYYNSNPEAKLFCPDISCLMAGTPALGEGKLALVFSYCDPEFKRTWIDVWLMKEDMSRRHGQTFLVDYDDNNEDSCFWDLAFTSVPPYPLPCLVLGCWKSNLLMLYTCGRKNLRPLFYDLASRRVLDYDVSADQDFFYKESLVSVGKPLPHQLDDEDKENIIPSWMFTMV